MMLRTLVVASSALVFASTAWSGFVTFESAGAVPAAITPARDAFRAAEQLAGAMALSVAFAAR